jgi:predicted negative regulator of RcsB-dependent stress response
LAGAGGIIAWFAKAQIWLIALALIAVSGGWGWVGWQSLRSKAKLARSTLYAMARATLLLALAIAWPILEPSVLRALAS